MKLLHFLLCLLLPILGWNQSTQIDSLEMMLAAEHHDTIRLDALEKLLQHYINEDLDKSLSLAQQLLEIAQRAGVPYYECAAYTAFGQVGGKLNNDIDSVMANFERALDCVSTMKDTLRQGKLFNKIGGVYQRYGYHPQALDYFQKGLTISRKYRDTLSMVPCLANMATVYRERDDYEKSLNYAQQALTYAKQMGHERYTGMITNNIANLYFNRAVYDTALVLYEEALASKRASGSKLSLIITLANIGGIHQEEGRFKEAEPYLREAYESASQLQYPYGQGLCLRYMAASAFRQKQYRKAIDLAQEGLAVLDKKAAVRYSRDFHELISHAYAELQQPAAALEHHKLFKNWNDSIYRLDIDQHIQELAIQNEMQQKDLENELLQKEKSLIQRKLQNRTNITFGLVVILFLATGWGIAVYRNNQTKKKMNSFLEAQVEARTNDLSWANKQLEKANYELKTFNYLASHDFKEPIRNIGSYVNLIARRLPEEVKDSLQDYFKIVHQSTSQLYTLIEDVASYSQLSTDQAAKQEAVDLQLLMTSVGKGLKPIMEAKDGQLVYQGLPTIRSNSSLLFVALNNLVENGLKFNQSPVPTVQVEYLMTEDQHQLIVSDNGIGIDAKYHEHIFTMFKRLHRIDQYQGSGIGLALVKLVVEKLGGTVKLESQLGSGSTFTISLPEIWEEE